MRKVAGEHSLLLRENVNFSYKDVFACVNT
jgi:hypothetical protein